MRIPSFFSKRRVRYRASELGVSSHSRIAEFTKNRSMIPGAIDESALLHVHTSYLTRYSADEFSALIGFPLFLVTSLYLLSRFLLRPLFTSSSSSSAFPPLFFHVLSVAAAVIAVIVVTAVPASSYPRQCHRAHVPRNRTAFSSVAWCTHTIRTLRFPADRSLPIDDSDRKVGEGSVFASARSARLITFAVAWKNVIQPSLGEEEKL